ncbi:MAG: hypothetical protein IPH85_01990 [Ignavibacteria bacterium]|nr:hypothetical protein [Ignavibacteria bacterium]MBK6419569.1 hypothetical protein [Ignavibacteria bacterium]MBK7033007.1 hypothetical protein [Ignavibacteria bacterium]MBK7184691.1 hypothetical protein [Ignavibacteria bacterium]MBK7413492.1 hypothetical protein [Ignavibacteria bacterium]
MADLRDVVGAILRDVTEARGQADLAVRDLVSSYAKDPILRAFTIPRTEIRDLKIDLKVAVRSVDDSPDDRARKEQRVRDVVRSSIASLPFPIDPRTEQVIIKTGLQSASAESVEKELTSSAKSEATRASEETKMDVYRDLIVVEERKDQDVRLVAFTTDIQLTPKKFTTIRDARSHADTVSKLRAGQTLTPQQQKQAEARMKEERAQIQTRLTSEFVQPIKQISEALAAKLAAIAAQPSEKRMVIDVVAEDLKDIPQHMISTVTISLDVNNILPQEEA